jgi:beta-glucosidase
LDDHTSIYKTNYQVSVVLHLVYPFIMKIKHIWFAATIYCSFTVAADISWSEAYAKAKVAVSKLTDKEKVTLGTGTGSGPCIGNTAAISKIGWPGLCLQDSPLAVRLAHNVTGGISGINTAATFDRDLVRQRAEDMGDEFRGKGINIQLGPDVNMARIPESGRNWEGFGEDPYLTGVMGGITVAGVQSKGVVSFIYGW